MDPRIRRARLLPLALLVVLLAGPIAAPVTAVAVDTDRDGLTNTWERTWSRTNPSRVDTDGDGLWDGRENPDRDGLTNRAEQNLGTKPRVGRHRPRRLERRRRVPRRHEPEVGREPARAGQSRSRHRSPRPTPTPRRPQTPTPEPHRPRRRPRHPRPTPTPAPTPTPTPTPPRRHPPRRRPHPIGGAPTLPGAPNCPVFPATTSGTCRVDSRPVAADSATLITTIGLDRGLHMDFGSYAGYGIPYNIVTSTTPRSTVTFDYDDESDQVGYPIPASPKIEGGSDRHILMVDKDACRLYELFDARQAGGAWAAGSGATWDLRSNALRPAGWTSADAAGLPILPGLVRYDEVAAGAIRHALRFTVPQTRRATSTRRATTRARRPRRRCRRWACASGSRRPTTPPGSRPQARAIAEALKKYGMILADNGSPWYITGVSDPRFDDDILHELDVITGRDLEVVDTTGLVNGP